MAESQTLVKHLFRMIQVARTDKRRQAGEETRRALMEATADALAAGGVRGVSLRAVSTAAEVNVAAAKYHFGSREALIAEVLRDATSQVYSAQDELLSALEARAEPASPRAWVDAWSRPFIDVVTSDCPKQRRLGRIASRALSDEDGIAKGIRDLAAATDVRVIRGLMSSVPKVDERDLWLRVAVMASALSGFAGGIFDPLIDRSATGRPLRERLLDLLEAIVVAPT